MPQTISVRGKNIQLEIATHKIKLTNDDQLSQLLKSDTESATDELVNTLKVTFKQQMQRDIDISNNSMAVEIWGHVYSEKFLVIVKSLPTFGLLDGIAEKLIEHCEVIDMGESRHDNNRFVWNGLSYFKSEIARLLPK